MIYDPGLFQLAREIRNSNKTFLGYPRLWSLVDSLTILKNRKRENLNIAEFGVGRGGSAMVLGWWINRNGGRLQLFDVFSQIPAPTDVDGEDAEKRYEKITREEQSDYYGNLPNLLEIIRLDLESVCPLERIELISGNFEETLPRLRSKFKIDFAHIDCDWYDSTHQVLTFLEGNFNPDGIIQIDDYEYWQGTKKAVDETNWLANYQKKLVEGALVIDMGKPE